jgi:methionyl aminopeptidase
MQDDVLQKYRSAGKILHEVMALASKRVEVGVPLLEVAELVEGSIAEKGGSPAFPCNISRGREAAHFTPAPGDKSCFGEEMVKLDIGVHVDGYIADAAVTVDLSGRPELVEASRAGLDAAIGQVVAGVSTSTIGKAIEDAITGYGFHPVANLTGHGLSRHLAHAEPTVPNIAVEKGVVLNSGDVIAIEPFATDGAGRISEAPTVEIFGLSGRRPIRAPQARALLLEIETSYGSLPFARRWLKAERVDYALSLLIKGGIVHKYPVLWEAEEAVVSQAEHTVIVTDDGCEVITGE